MRFVLAAIVGIFFAEITYAGDGVPSQGLLSDFDLYHSMACGALPGEACTQPLVRWNTPDIRVVLDCAMSNYPKDLAPAVEIALDQAVASINAAKSGLTLHRCLSNELSADFMRRL